MEQNILLATDKRHMAQSLGIKYSQESCSLFLWLFFTVCWMLASSTSHGSLGGMDSSYFHGCGQNGVR